MALSELDDVDRAILARLAVDARCSVQSIADQVGLKRSAVFARIQRLEANGIVLGYRAALDPEALDRSMAALVFLQVAHGSGKDFLTATTAIVQELAAMPAVLEIHTLAGDDDMVVKVRVSGLRELEDGVLRRMSGIANVTRVRSRLVLSTRLERPLDPSSLSGKSPRKGVKKTRTSVN